jgi:hypothetical protein
MSIESPNGLAIMRRDPTQDRDGGEYYALVMAVAATKTERDGADLLVTIEVSAPFGNAARFRVRVRPGGTSAIEDGSALP